MGQYFYIVNIDKKEYLHPHKLGSGLKFYEILSTKVPQVLAFLLRQSDGGGGGDINEEFETKGRWAGDRITIVGDYDNSGIYDKAQIEFEDISLKVRKDFESAVTTLGARWDIY